MKTLKLFVAVALVALTPACFVARNNINTPLDPDRLALLVPGTSTADDVLGALGAPSDVVQLGRRSAWRYDHSQKKSAALSLLIVTMVNTDAQADRVWVFFDEADVLTHMAGTFEAQGARYKLPLQD
jgi:outer membrane protein assembly factor BamE (lipoprotein component of BamABCDE complex)